MTRNQQQMYKDISNLTKALTKLVKVIEKLANHSKLKGPIKAKRF